MKVLTLSGDREGVHARLLTVSFTFFVERPRSGDGDSGAGGIRSILVGDTFSESRLVFSDGRFPSGLRKSSILGGFPNNTGAGKK